MPSSQARTMASARISRPSASVLSTATVVPPYWVRTSPGRWAVAEGMFSAMGTVAVTVSGRPSSATRTIVATTAAAPAMSEVMSSIPAAGLMEMPPVSKVMPLPTRPTFAVPPPE